MAAIVSGNRRTELRQPRVAVPSHKVVSIRQHRSGPYWIAATGASIPNLDADVATVREHFGVNISRALGISLHLTAKAIREGRLNV